MGTPDLRRRDDSKVEKLCRLFILLSVPVQEGTDAALHVGRRRIHWRFALGATRCIAAPIMQRNTKSEATSQAVHPGRSIVLVGMMGSGKSSIGRRLGARLGLPFIDADDEIEKAAGMTISEIFERFGEAQFRDGERRVIARLMDEPRQVIATGGGAFMNDETRNLILSKADAIWLDADIDVLVERVKRREGRPLLKNRDPRAVLAELASVRNPFYALAPIHIKSGIGPHEATVERIMKALPSCP